MAKGKKETYEISEDGKKLHEINRKGQVCGIFTKDDISESVKNQLLRKGGDVAAEFLKDVKTTNGAIATKPAKKKAAKKKKPAAKKKESASARAAREASAVTNKK